MGFAAASTVIDKERKCGREGVLGKVAWQTSEVFMEVSVKIKFGNSRYLGRVRLLPKPSKGSAKETRDK